MRKVLFLVLALCLAASAKVAVSSPKITEKKPRYAISIEYPRISIPGNPKAERAINSVLEADAQKMAADFRSEFAKIGQDAPKDSPPWSYDSSYKVVYETDKLIVFLQSSYDYTGGAHGMPITEAFTFDLATGKRLHITDWYKAGYLKILSDYSRAALQADKELIGDPQWIVNGTKPDADNFPVVYPTARGMNIVFPPYQVAAYASGQPEVLVPYSKLAPVAKPGTPTSP